MYTNNDVLQVKAGSVPIGGGAPVSIQTMWKKPLESNVSGIISVIKELKLLGCDIIRFAVPDMDSAEILGKIALLSPVPVVADIHFDYKIALKCAELNVNKIRINPGNIGAEWKIREVLSAASDRNIPIRVGINGGSLPLALRKNSDKAKAMIIAAGEEINLLEKYNFRNAVFSLKASDVKTTIKANTGFAEKFRYPLHLGVTEAGPLIEGVVKNTAGLLPLLSQDIGSTVRVSLSSAPSDEIIAAKAILYQAGKRNEFVNLVSCPKCGRSTFDVHSFLSSVYERINCVQKPVTIAVMGCAVNGPQEAKEADLGITGAGNSVVIFKKGEIIKKITAEEAAAEFIKEIDQL